MNGRKKGAYRNGKDILEELLSLETWDEDISGNKGKMTIAELMHVRMVKKALNGDLKAYAEILDRLEGKAVQKVEEEVNHKFESKPLAELIQFTTPKKRLDDETNEVVDMSEVADNVFSMDGDVFDAPDMEEREDE